MLIFLSSHVTNNLLDMTRTESGSEFSVRHPINISAVNGIPGTKIAQKLSLRTLDVEAPGHSSEVCRPSCLTIPFRCIHCSLLLMLPLPFRRILMRS